MRFRFAWRAVPYWLLRKIGLPPGLHWRVASLLNDNFLLGVMGIIQDDAGRVLLFRHTYRRSPWGFPGGWMTRGESPLAALEREVAEESGLVVHAERLLLVGISPDRPKMEFVVRATVVGGQFRPSGEVSAIAWSNPKGAPLTHRYRSVLDRVLAEDDTDVGFYQIAWKAERASGD